MGVSRTLIMKGWFVALLGLWTIACGVSSAKMRREETTRIYRVPYESAFQTGLDIVRDMGMTLENAGKDVGFITAKSGTSWLTFGGQTISIQYRKAGSDATEVFVSARMNPSGTQFVGWGESAKFVRKIIADFDARLVPARHAERE